MRRHDLQHTMTALTSFEQTAQDTLRGAMGYPLETSPQLLPNHYLHHPLAESYVLLIKALIPFRGLFVEPDLRGKCTSRIGPLPGSHTPLIDAVNKLVKSVEGINFANTPVPSPISTRLIYITQHFHPWLFTLSQKSTAPSRLRT